MTPTEEPTGRHAHHFGGKHSARAIELAKQFGVSPSTVVRDGQLVTALEALGPDAYKAYGAGKVRASWKIIIAAGKVADPVRRAELGRTIAAGEIPDPRETIDPLVDRFVAIQALLRQLGGLIRAVGRFDFVDPDVTGFLQAAENNLDLQLGDVARLILARDEAPQIEGGNR